MKEKRTCSSCINGVSISVNNDILCRIKGAVSPDYACSKHKFTPESKSFKDLNYKCFSCANFVASSNESESSSSIGLCQLFSVRQFDGKQKNACSKFVKHIELKIS